MKKNKVKLTICGVDYNIISDDDEKYIIEIAKEVDKRMTDILNSNSRLSTTMAAILTSLDYCDAANKYKREIKSLKESSRDDRRYCSNYKENIDNANIKISSLEKEILELKNQLSSTQKENSLLIQELSDSRLELEDLSKTNKKEETMLQEKTKCEEEDVLNFFDFYKNVKTL